jgi:hypothetical protein
MSWIANIVVTELDSAEHIPGTSTSSCSANQAFHMDATDRTLRCTAREHADDSDTVVGTPRTGGGMAANGARVSGPREPEARVNLPCRRLPRPCPPWDSSSLSAASRESCSAIGGLPVICFAS